MKKKNNRNNTQKQKFINVFNIMMFGKKNLIKKNRNQSTKFTR